MIVEKTEIPGVVIVTPQIFGDERGFFMESYNQKRFQENGIPEFFVQDNHSRSRRGVVRGLHFQKNFPQGKLVRCIRGDILDVILDIRIGSPTFGKVITIPLTEENKKQVWVPAGLAHGFVVLSDIAEFLYKVTDFYHPEDEKGVLWNDPALNIDWQVEEAILSAKDKELPTFEKARKDFPLFK